MHDAPLPPKRVQRRCLTVLDASMAGLDGSWPAPKNERKKNGPRYVFLVAVARLVSPPSDATLLTINRTRTAGPFDCVLPRTSRVCPPSITAVPAPAGLCKGLPARACVSIFFSPHRLPPPQSALALSAALLSSPPSSPPPPPPSSTERRPRAVEATQTKHDPCAPYTIPSPSDP